MPRLAAALLCCALLVACDAGAPSADEAPPPADEPRPQLGAPVAGVAPTLRAVRAQARSAALEWQDEPVLAEMTFTLVDERIAAAALTYVAAGADRLLLLEGDEHGFRQLRVTLATFGLAPVPGDALAAVPVLPDGVQEPAALAAAAAASCDLAVAEVRYETAAPWAWDGQQWTAAPTWRAVAVAGEAFAVVDPVTGAATC